MKIVEIVLIKYKNNDGITDLDLSPWAVFIVQN